MLDKFKSHLSSLKKKTITIDQLRQFSITEQLTYDQFGKIIETLEENNFITMVKSHGRSVRPPYLANTYRIQTAAVREDYFTKIYNYRNELHPLIHLDTYFTSEEGVIEEDIYYLRKISKYLFEQGLPEDIVPAPERSFELVNDEKWIVEKNGETILRRSNLWDKMSIMPVADPLMFALNGANINVKQHLHLIVENKTTYQGLLPALKNSSFTSLIYGSGWKIEKSLENFHSQLLINGDHKFYYFGDLDKSGISIWYKVYKQYCAIPALPFYSECLKYQPSPGKETQSLLNNALEEFSSFFDKEATDKLNQMISWEQYLPQEVLKAKQLQKILGAWNDAAL